MRNAKTYFPFQLSVYYVVFMNVRMIIDPMYLLLVAGITLHNKTSLIVCHQTLCPLNGRCGDMILIMYTMKRLHIYTRIKSDNNYIAFQLYMKMQLVVE